METQLEQADEIRPGPRSSTDDFEHYSITGLKALMYDSGTPCYNYCASRLPSPIRKNGAKLGPILSISMCLILYLCKLQRNFIAESQLRARI